MGEPGGVGLGQRVGDLTHQPGGATRWQGAFPRDQDVERVALAPLVDDVAPPVGGLGVEHPEQPTVDDRAGSAGGLEDGGCPVVVGGEEVDRHGPVEDEVVRAPEATGAVLGEEVVEPVALGEDVTGLHRCRHRPPFPPACVDHDGTGYRSLAPL